MVTASLPATELTPEDPVDRLRLALPIDYPLAGPPPGMAPSASSTCLRASAASASGCSAPAADASTRSRSTALHGRPTRPTSRPSRQKTSAMSTRARLPAYDLLAAGFPCQPFSIAGVSKNLSLGREHGFDHAKSGNLFFEIERLIRDGRPPKVVFLENVRNLKSHDQRRTFIEIRRRLDDLGYELNDRIIDAQRWVPQHRERIFIIGFHRDTFDGQRFEFPELPIAARPDLGSALQADYDPKYVLSQHLWDYLQEYKAKHRAAGNGFGYGLVRTRRCRAHPECALPQGWVGDPHRDRPGPPATADSARVRPPDGLPGRVRHPRVGHAGISPVRQCRGSAGDRVPGPRGRATSPHWARLWRSPASV